MDKLHQQHCLPCEGGVDKLTTEEATRLMTELSGWEFRDDFTKIFKPYSFKNYYHTIAFVNLIAWISNQEGHHPDLQVGYNYCHVSYTTHTIGGLSKNDFICANKIDQITQTYAAK